MDTNLLKFVYTRRGDPPQDGWIGAVLAPVFNATSAVGPTAQARLAGALPRQTTVRTVDQDWTELAWQYPILPAFDPALTVAQEAQRQSFRSPPARRTVRVPDQDWVQPAWWAETLPAFNAALTVPSEAQRRSFMMPSVRQTIRLSDQAWEQASWFIEALPTFSSALVIPSQDQMRLEGDRAPPRRTVFAFPGEVERREVPGFDPVFGVPAMRLDEGRVPLRRTVSFYQFGGDNIFGVIPLRQAWRPVFRPRRR